MMMMMMMMMMMVMMSYIWGTKKRKPRPDWSSLGPARFQFPDERPGPLTKLQSIAIFISNLFKNSVPCTDP